MEEEEEDDEGQESDEDEDDKPSLKALEASVAQFSATCQKLKEIQLLPLVERYGDGSLQPSVS